VSLEIALARFEGEGTAVLKYADAKDRSADDARWAQEVGFVEHHHSGRLLMRGTFASHYLDVDESDRISQKGAGEGGAAGGLIGVLGGPVGIAVGIVVGGIIGSQAGTVSDVETEPQELAEQLRAAVPRSSSAIVLIAESRDIDEMRRALGDDAQDLTRRTLSAEQASALEVSLSAAPRVSPGAAGGS
jgi:uncharacterized membrane protein